jgi:cytochrome c biogenesis protein
MTTEMSKNKPKAPDFFQELKNDLWKFITSISLAIVLITSIVVISIVGTLVPQADKTRSVDYIERYGVEGYQWLQRFQLDQVFSSSYFRAIMLLFFLNMLACTFKRLKASFLYAKTEQRSKMPQAFERMPVNYNTESHEDTEELIVRAQNALRSRRYRIERKGDQLLAEKWRWERFGIDVFHIGILVLLVGGLLTAQFGFRSFQVAHEGEIFSIRDSDSIVRRDDFVVRVDEFWSENYAETERVMDWHSTLTIVENGQDVLTETVEVNVPMYYDGIRLFQSSFGQDWENNAHVTVRVEDENGASLGEYEAKVNESFELADLGLLVNVGAFLPDFALTDNQIAYSRSQRLLNPAVFIRVYDKNNKDDDGNEILVHRTWALSQLPELQNLLSSAPIRFHLTGMTAPEFTGIQVNYDPGYDVAIAGFGLMIIGILIHLYFTHRQVWVHIDAEAGRVYIGGRARSHSKGFEIEVERMFAKISTDTPI